MLVVERHLPRRRLRAIALVTTVVLVAVATVVAAGMGLRVSPFARARSEPPAVGSTVQPVAVHQPVVASAGAPTATPPAVPAPSAPEQTFARLKSEGLAAAQRGAYPHAAERLKAASELNPRDRDLWNSLGVVLTRQALRAEAAAAFGQALKVDDTFPAHRNLAVLFDQDGNTREAARHYRAFLKWSLPSDPDREGVQRRLTELTSKRTAP